LAVVLSVLCLLSTISAQTRDYATQARQILSAAGVKGGLIVHIGCRDGKLTAAMHAGESHLVQGLDRDQTNVEKARQYISSISLYGKVTADRMKDNRLPYTDNLVNLVVSEDLDDVPLDEVMRVLSPHGVAYIRQNGKWKRTVKSRPEEIDEWTHYLHGPDNNAVAKDSTVASPFHAQWIGDPKWARHHNHLASTSAMVSSGGRMFAIVDEGPTPSLALPAKWRLVARDAFNGVVLWKRTVGPWEGVLRPFRSGPTELTRRLVAIGDKVFVTLGYHKPLRALDAATGKVVRTYADTEGTLEIIYNDGVLYLVAGTIDRTGYAESMRKAKASPAPRNKRILAINAETGDIIWEKSNENTCELMPTTLCVQGNRVYFQNTSHIFCIDARTGQVEWQTERPVRTNRFAWSAPTLVVHEEVVLSADCSAKGSGAVTGKRTTWKVTAAVARGERALGELIAFSAKDGSELWRCATALGYNSPPDVLIANGLVWTGNTPGRNTPDFTEGRDLHTGQVRKRLETASAFTETHHHRCHRNKATEHFILLGRTGVELIDLEGKKPVRHCWIRGGCQYGVMPANGLLYLPPHSCACYIQSKLSGFWALAPERKESETSNLKLVLSEAEGSQRLQKGPAYGQLGTKNSKLQTENDWPTYRQDQGRTSRTNSSVPVELNLIWRSGIGGRLTSPVIAGGKLLVAVIDTHIVHAVDAEGGLRQWQFRAGGRIDSPPTVYEGKAIFGCADGSVYCLRMTDGELIWRFRAAPIDRRTVASGQIESLWPVTGSVLVREGIVYCTAGRSSYLDGGMYLYRLDATTGDLLGQTRFYDRDPQTGEQPEEIIEDVELPGTLPDVLVCDGDHIYLRDRVLDFAGTRQDKYVPHLYSSAGLLDDSWWHRTYWLWGERNWGRASGWHVMPNFRPSARIMVTDEKTVFGYGRKNVRTNNMQGYHLFRADKQVTPVNKQIRNNNKALVKYQRPAKVNYHWSRESPIVVRAMVLAGHTLFAAGPVMEGADEPRFDENAPAELIAVDTKDGRTLSRRSIEAQPVFDGMAAADGKIYVSTVDGRIVCLGKRRGS
jgi:outer membrane protein assembly factor BamB